MYMHVFMRVCCCLLLSLNLQVILAQPCTALTFIDVLDGQISVERWHMLCDESASHEAFYTLRQIGQRVLVLVYDCSAVFDGYMGLSQRQLYSSPWHCETLQFSSILTTFQKYSKHSNFSIKIPKEFQSSPSENSINHSRKHSKHSRVIP